MNMFLLIRSLVCVKSMCKPTHPRACVRDIIKIPSALRTLCSSSHVNGESPMIIMATRQCVQTYGGELGRVGLLSQGRAG